MEKIFKSAPWYYVDEKFQICVLRPGKTRPFREGTERQAGVRLAQVVAGASGDAQPPARLTWLLALSTVALSLVHRPQRRG